MLKTSIENLAGEIGFDIGASDDVVQAKLLNGFCKGLNNSILQERDLDLQICYIVDKLDANSLKILTKIQQFIETKIKN